MERQQKKGLRKKRELGKKKRESFDDGKRGGEFLRREKPGGERKSDSIRCGAGITRERRAI